jgi:hypothetical protein
MTHGDRVRRWSTRLAISLPMLLAVLFSSVVAGASPNAAGVVRGTLQVCVVSSPVLSLHRAGGKIVATASWHPPQAGGTKERVLDFSFSERPGHYYLTMNNQYPMPAPDRQIHLAAGQRFTTHIVAGCKSPRVASQ